VAVTTIRAFADLIRDVCQDGWDAPIAVTGPRGVGKSTFLLQFFKEWSDDYNPVRDMPMDRDGLVELIDNGGRYKGIHCDEAIGMLFSRNWSDPEQIALLSKFDRSRHMNQVIGIAIPRFAALDSHLRNSVVRFWVHVYKRTLNPRKAYAHVFQADDNPAATDVWDLKGIHKRWINGSLQRHYLYRGEIVFDPLTKGEEEVYDEIKRIKRSIVERQELTMARLRNKWRRGG
jgi:hypothetical protein